MEKIIDFNGKEVKVGDKVRGEGFLEFNGNYRVDLTPVVTVREDNGRIFFGGLSMESFRIFHLVNDDYKPPNNGF